MVITFEGALILLGILAVLLVVAGVLMLRRRARAQHQDPDAPAGPRRS